MSYLVVTVGRNCKRWARRSLQSIADQEYDDYRVCVVDDASTDGTTEVARRFCEQQGWLFQERAVVSGAMYNQYQAWRALEPKVGDVIVWVDLDDRLAHDRVFQVLDEHYSAGALMTYGNYRSDPLSNTCPDVRAYPADVLREGRVREAIRDGEGILFNHLRTVSWEVLRRLTVEDLQDSSGQWFRAGPDMAVMVPAIEMAGLRCHFIDEVLYVYTSDNRSSEWRRWPEMVRKSHQDVLDRAPRRPLS